MRRSVATQKPSSRSSHPHVARGPWGASSRTGVKLRAGAQGQPRRANYPSTEAYPGALTCLCKDDLRTQARVFWSAPGWAPKKETKA